MSKEIIKKENNALSLDMSGLDMSGLVSVNSEILKRARLKLNNPMSSSVSSGEGKSGEFTCSSLEKNYGNSVEIIPVLVSESASYLDKDTSDLVCVSHDLINGTTGGKCASCSYGVSWMDWKSSDGRPPACKKSIDMLVLDKDLNKMEINFRKTNYKCGRELVNLIVNDPNGIPFGRAYTIKSEQKSEGSKVYYSIDFKNISKRVLSKEEITKIIPIAKKCLEMKRSGAFATPIAEDDTLPI